MITYYHQLDPFLVQFSENFGIRWYSLAYIVGAVCAYFAGIYLLRKKRIQLNSHQLMDVIFYGALGAVIGGRLGYCVFYSPDLLLSFDISSPFWKSFPFWGVLKIHQGGMASHGGIIGLLLSLMVYAYRYKISFFSLLDLAAIPASVGIFLGRIANFINGELYGRIVEGKTWLAVRFPSELYLWADKPHLYKKQLISLKELLPSLDSAFQEHIKIPSAYLWEEWVLKAIEGSPVHEGYVSHICHLIVQNSEKAPIKEILEPLLFLRYPSQLYQSLLGGFMTFLIVCVFWLKPRKAGLIAFVWICSYLLFRILTEFYRQPDPQIGFQFLNLTRGQWLSVLLYVFVVLYGYFVYRQEPKGFKKI